MKDTKEVLKHLNDCKSMIDYEEMPWEEEDKLEKVRYTLYCVIDTLINYFKEVNDNENSLFR